MQAELEEMGIAFHIGDAVESVERAGDRMRSDAQERRHASRATS